MFYVAWLAWAVFVVTVAALVVIPIIDRLGKLLDAIFEPRRFSVRAHEETEWGTMFAVVDPKGNIVGLDRYAVAKARCRELNSDRKG